MTAITHSRWRGLVGCRSSTPVTVSRPTRPIDGETIYLRAFDLGDAELLTALVVGGDLPEYSPVPEAPDTESPRRWVVAQNDAWISGRVLVLAVVDALSHELVGKIELRRALSDEDVAEVGYFVAEQYRGSGVASEALNLVSEWAFGCGLLVLTARIAESNLPSQRVAEKSGFIWTGNQVEGHVTVGYWWKNRPVTGLDHVLEKLLAQ